MNKKDKKDFKCLMRHTNHKSMSKLKNPAALAMERTNK